MRIGIVLFGHLRSFKQTLSSFENLKKTLAQSGQVDVFCHTWDIEESVTAAWWKEHKPDDPPPATVNAKEVEEKYAPARYIIESSIQFDDSGYIVNTSIPISGILSMLYTQQRSFGLLKQHETENDFRYDIIIKARYDLLYEIAPGFSDIIQDCLTNSKVYLPFSNPYELIGSYSDIFAVGSREEMEKYFSFCSNFKIAIEYYKSDDYGQFIPEFCMTVYLEKIGVKRDELYGIRLHILRMKGDKFLVNSDRNFRGNGPLCFYSETICKCKKILFREPDIVIRNSSELVKKYMSWINTQPNKTLLHEYADFYSGHWIGISKVKKLAVKGRNNNIFNSHVMKSFFEEALRNAKYGQLKKIWLAFTLTIWAGYGIFFFRVLK